MRNCLVLNTLKNGILWTKILVKNMLVVKKETMTSSLDMMGSCFGKISYAFLIVPFGIC